MNEFNKYLENLEDELDSDKQKEFYEKILMPVFKKINKLSEERIDQIEEKIKQSIFTQNSSCSLCFGLLDFNNLENNKKYFSPISSLNTNVEYNFCRDNVICFKKENKLINALKNDINTKIVSFFVKKNLKDFLKIDNMKVHGCIISTNGKKYKAQFKLCINTDDEVKKEEWVNKLFESNRNERPVIYNPFSKRIADMYITECNDIDKIDNISKIEIDDDINDFIVNLIPVWNIYSSSRKLNTSDVPIRRPIGTHESIIYKIKLKEENLNFIDVLVSADRAEIYNTILNKEKNSIEIITDSKDDFFDEDWYVHYLMNIKDVKYVSEYPLINVDENEFKFIYKYKMKYGKKPVLTKAEIKNVINVYSKFLNFEIDDIQYEDNITILKIKRIKPDNIFEDEDISFIENILTDVFHGNEFKGVVI